MSCARGRRARTPDPLSVTRATSDPPRGGAEAAMASRWRVSVCGAGGETLAEHPRGIVPVSLAHTPVHMPAPRP